MKRGSEELRARRHLADTSSDPSRRARRQALRDDREASNRRPDALSSEIIPDSSVSSSFTSIVRLLGVGEDDVRAEPVERLVQDLRHPAHVARPNQVCRVDHDLEPRRVRSRRAASAPCMTELTTLLISGSNASVTSCRSAILTASLHRLDQAFPRALAARFPGCHFHMSSRVERAGAERDDPRIEPAAGRGEDLEPPQVVLQPRRHRDRTG